MPRVPRPVIAAEAARKIPPSGHGICARCHARVPLVDVGGELLAARHCLPVGQRPTPRTYAECSGTGSPPEGRPVLSHIRP